MNQTTKFMYNRRLFLKNVIPTGIISCLGCSHLFALSKSKVKNLQDELHKFSVDSEMTYQQVFEFAFTYSFIPLMKCMAENVGKENLIDMLKSASSKVGADKGSRGAKRSSNHDLQTATSYLRRKNPSPLWKHSCTYELIEDNDKVVKVKYTECLVAKIFREANAADIGYAAFCHGDFAIPTAFNPKLKLERTKTLMQGHDCCNHKYLYKG